MGKTRHESRLFRLIALLGAAMLMVQLFRRVVLGEFPNESAILFLAMLYIGLGLEIYRLITNKVQMASTALTFALLPAGMLAAFAGIAFFNFSSASVLVVMALHGAGVMVLTEQADRRSTPNQSRV